MAHKTRIGGTAYEISGGKTLVDGTAYSIKNGKTLVGGTAYDIGFVPIITFYIGEDGSFFNMEYQAEQGMTWREWVNSAYNLNGVYSVKRSQIIRNGYYIQNVTPDGVINEGQIYIEIPADSTM